jgi:hypothetical protein
METGLTAFPQSVVVETTLLRMALRTLPRVWTVGSSFRLTSVPLKNPQILEGVYL